MIYNESDTQVKKHLMSYSKPNDICTEINGSEKKNILLPSRDFIHLYKQKIENCIKGCNLNLRLAKEEDVNDAFDFIQDRFKRGFIEEASTYDIFEFIKYGHGIVIYNKQNKIVGCLFEEGNKDYKKISVSRRLAIDESCRGKHLGELVTFYSCLVAMERGATVKTGLIKFNNFQSHHIHLNNLGWILDSFYINIEGRGIFFSISIPLNPKSLLANKIDRTKILSYISKRKEGIDYCLINGDDPEMIEEVYKKNNFKIVAIVKINKKRNNTPVFFALPNKSLKYTLLP